MERNLPQSEQQAQRLRNLDSRTTDIIFDALESSRFLTRTATCMYRTGGKGNGPVATALKRRHSI